MQIEIGDLPVWKGVQNKPGYDKLKFGLYTDHGLIRLNLPNEEISRISTCYNKEDYTFITSPPGSSDWGNRLGDFYFKILSGWVGNLSGKKVIEIGSGTLYIAQRTIQELNAQQFIACDPALINEKISSKNICISKKFFSFELFEKDFQKTDLIISINNLEHIPDFNQYLEDVRMLLNPEKGAFFVIVPDCSRGFKIGDLGICVHEHMNYFTEETLISTLLSSGFSIEKIMSLEDTLFALARPEQNELFPQGSDRQSDKILENFGNLVKSNLNYSTDILEQAKSRGPTALHGCCAGLNNTLELLGIHDDPNIFLFDGDIQKKGKYLPVFHKPIYSSDDVFYRHMKTIIITALTYYEEIKRGIEVSHHIHPGSIHPIIERHKF